MTLTPQEYREFLDTHLDLLYFISKHKNLVDSKMDFQSFLKKDLKLKFRCREELLNNLLLLDEYVATNSATLTQSQITILRGFHNKITGTFVILKCFAKHAIFINSKDNKVYGVKALGDRFDELFTYFPRICDTTILPFKDKIIYDGFLCPYNIYIGPNIKRDIMDTYRQAKKNNTIITSLP